jgi:hypothetical protein
MSKSAISRPFERQTDTTLAELMSRDLSGLLPILLAVGSDPCNYVNRSRTRRR